MVFYLVGPSGAGKSTLGQLLADHGHVRFADSDEEFIGNAEGQPWPTVLPQLMKWESDKEDPPLLVALGAGTQDIDRTEPNSPVLEWLADHCERVIAVMCTPAETLSRRMAHHDSLQSVSNIEFDEARKQIYQLAAHRIVTSDLTESQAAVELELLIRPEAPRDGDSTLSQTLLR